MVQWGNEGTVFFFFSLGGIRNQNCSSLERCCFCFFGTWSMFCVSGKHSPKLAQVPNAQTCCSQVHCRSFRTMNSVSSHNFAAVLPGDSVAGVVVTNGILNFLNIYNTLLVVRLVLTWFPNTPPQIVSPLRYACYVLLI